jgi:hypothetical protein
VTEHTPFIDFENLPAPGEGFVVTLFITVRNVARSRAFYSEVLGGQVVLEENPCIVKLSNMRDPDGYMIEVGQATGVLHGQLAKKRPEDLPG